MTLPTVTQRVLQVEHIQIFATTGKRLRKMPVDASQLKST